MDHAQKAGRRLEFDSKDSENGPPLTSGGENANAALPEFKVLKDGQ